MSTPTPGARLRVTGLFRAAYRWLRDEPPASQPVTPTPPAAPQPTPSPSFSAAKSPPPLSGPPTGVDGETLHLPLQPILNTLPPELKAKQRQQTVGALTIPVPMSKIMAQLPHGAVKLSFGELRLAAPGVFVLATDRDHVLVSVPLNEILKRISLSKLARRTDQKVVEVPQEVSSPFGENGKGLVLSTETEKPSFTLPARSMTPAAPVQPTPPIPFQRGMSPTPSSESAAPSRSVTPALPPPRSASAIPLPKPALPTVASPLRSAKPLDAPTPASPPKPNGGNGGNGCKAAAPVPTGAPSVASPTEVSPVAPLAQTGDSLQVPLLNLMNAWPQAVRLEIAQLNLIDAKVVVPVSILEKGLRQGKVEFPWKLVRAWIRPEVRSQNTANDSLVLELSLNVIAPLFVARRQPANKARRRVAVDETIPNLFFGFPQTDAAPGVASNAAPVTAPAAAKSPDTNFYTWGDDEEERAKTGQAGAGNKPSTDFLKRFATPNEIVTRAAALDGVAGALVALPDGLAVASRVPPTFNADTLAAFLPQIFGKVSQCTKELRMGNLNNLNFTVGNVPWKIFRVNNVFFAAFGRAEEPLPTAQLAALAAELDRKAKVA